MFQSRKNPFVQYLRGYISAKVIVPLVFIMVLFVLASYLSSKYEDDLQDAILKQGSLGAMVYIMVTIVSVVIAPMSTFPLIPIAATIWGPFWTAVFSILGWSVGAMIAFLLARKFGKPLVKKFFSLEKLEHIERVIPKQHVFWSLVFLRMGLPVDLLSYALGLFSKIPFSLYAKATVIGVTPFAFVISYLGIFPLYYQIFSLLGGVGIMLLAMRLLTRK